MECLGQAVTIREAWTEYACIYVFQLLAIRLSMCIAHVIVSGGSFFFEVKKPKYQQPTYCHQAQQKLP
ncbi:unnamed protein product [Fusarium graminearum]|uniref:Chromosome 3, complete genome n=1 Tax=Gibberella zeae (strain ATCC MYA-4620 / CBS 123657 / FGSC 9075 / NRRL 31084 / PH-1) TaxID=229533 RepID=A0A0E0SIQ9_GIBZE|nr:hypothetical protein FG05_12844 [Fusarium graminearum]CEF86322.1 unnamed protein product [Fusarium graminearum]